MVIGNVHRNNNNSMKKEADIKQMLVQLQAQEGASFHIEEDAILLEYQKINANRSGIAIKVLTIFGGLLASLAFMGFLFIAEVYDSGLAMLTMGLAFIAGAIWLSKAYDKLIIDTTAVSLFVIGLFEFTFGVGSLHANENMICILLIIVAIATLVIVQNYILAFIAVLLINGSVITLILENSHNLLQMYIAVALITLTLLMLHEASLITVSKKISRLYNPIRLALILSLLAAWITLVGNFGWNPSSIHFNLVSSIPAIAAIFYTLPRIIRLLNIQPVAIRVGVYLITALLLAPTIYAPAIAGTLLLTLLSFWVNYKTGFALGIIALIYFICQYYYDLRFTLLTKSLLMMASGILFLLFYLLTHKKLNQHEKI